MTYDPIDTNDDGVVDADVDNQSVSTDETGITGGDGATIVYRDDATGDVVTKQFDTPQAAIDALPRYSDGFGSAAGEVYLYSRGGANRYSGFTLDIKGGIVKGSGIHTPVEETQSTPTVDVTNADCDLRDMWIDNQGTGAAIDLNNEQCRVQQVNVDYAGSECINAEGFSHHQIGPYCELKAGTHGIKGNDGGQNTIVWGVFIDQFNADHGPTNGVTPGAQWLVSNVYVTTDGNNGASRGLNLAFPNTTVTNCFVTGPWRSYGDGNPGPTVAYDVAATGIQGCNLREIDCGVGLRLRTGAGNCEIRGRFPSGISIESGANDCFIHDPQSNWSDVSGSGTRIVLNGVGLNAGDPNTTGDWNGNGKEGVKVRDTTNSNTYLYNNGTWSQIASA